MPPISALKLQHLCRTMALACLLAAQAAAHAAATEPAAPPPPPAHAPPASREFQLVIENDWLSKTDRYYTNGFKVGLGRQFEPLARPIEDFLGSVAPKWFRPGDGVTQFGLFLGQNMYTPRNIRLSDPQPLDRPWAAWLYVGGVMQRANADKGLDTLELDLGVVGPGAGGRRIQSEWHKLVGAAEPRGWHHQLPNEPAVQISYIRKRRIGGARFDFIPHVGVAAGTVMTFARAGGMLRAGWNMKSFGIDTIEPGGVILQNTRPHADTSEGFVFLDVDHRLVARNMFLDGSLFHDSPGVLRRPHVYDLKLGAALRLGVVRFSVTRVRRSEEFHTVAGGGGGPQYFHSINIGIELPSTRSDAP